MRRVNQVTDERLTVLAYQAQERLLREGSLCEYSTIVRHRGKNKGSKPKFLIRWILAIQGKPDSPAAPPLHEIWAVATWLRDAIDLGQIHINLHEGKRAAGFWFVDWHEASSPEQFWEKGAFFEWRGAIPIRVQ